MRVLLIKADTIHRGAVPADYRLRVYDSRNGGPELNVGELYLEGPDAGLVKAVGELLGSLNPAVFRFQWDGLVPPPADLPVAKIQKVLRMFGAVS
jgi:hypothetical protein